MPNILKKIRNLLPYFLLIGIYFFFVNLEANKENKANSNNTKKLEDNNSRATDESFRLRIPVIPFNQ